MANSQTDMHLTHCSTGEPLAGQTLSAMLLRLIEGDDELRSQLAEARRRNLHRVTTIRLASLIAPSDFTREALARLGERTSAPVWRAGTVDPWREWLEQNIRRRIAELLTEAFDALRAGSLVATGILPASGAPTAVPDALWASPSVQFDVRNGALLAGPTVLFIGVVVSSPAPPPRMASRAALDRFACAFGEAILAADRRFTLGELVDAVRQHLGVGVSEREVADAVRRASPRAWAGSGRRAACAVPTPGELAQAARQAAESPA